MTTHKKVSVLPIYLVGLTWLSYALLFPLNTRMHYVLCAGLSLVVFVAGKAIRSEERRVGKECRL